MGNSNSGFFQTPQAAANTCGIELEKFLAHEKVKHITADWDEGRKIFRKSEIELFNHRRQQGLFGRPRRKPTSV